MAFAWPVMLWALLALPLLLWGYAGLLRRQARARQRLADAHLLSRLLPPVGPLRRHLPIAFHLSAVALLILATARPSAAIPLPVNRAAVVIAIDTSKSMIAEDIKPSRLEAAKRAAREFIVAMPGSARIGLIAFSDYGTVLVPPSTERQALAEALDRLQPQQATAVGSAILEALRILPLRREFLGERLERLRGPVPPDPLPAPGLPGPAPTPGPAAPPPVEALPPAAILIMSDGVSNLGTDPRAAAALAAEARVKIYTIGLGTPGGTVTQYQGQLVLVPFDAAILQEVARQTGGEYFGANDLPQLRKIYRQLGRAIGWERRRTEITSIVAGVAAGLMLTGGLLSMLWFRRLP